MTRLIDFLRTGDEVVESTVRGLYDTMREKNTGRELLLLRTAFDYFILRKHLHYKGCDGLLPVRTAECYN